MLPYGKRACPTLTLREMTSVPFSPQFINVKIAIAGVIVWVYGPVWIYVHSCYIKAAAMRGNVEALLKIFSWWLCGKARPPWAPSCLPSWLFCHFTPCLGWILERRRGLYLTHGCSGSTPHRALQISFCSMQACMLALFLSSFFFLEAH